MNRRTFVAGGVLCAAFATTAWAQAPPAAPVTPMDESRRVKVEDIDRHLADKVLLLDVRESQELAEFGTLEGAVHIPIGQLEKRMGELPKDRLILTA